MRKYSIIYTNNDNEVKSIVITDIDAEHARSTFFRTIKNVKKINSTSIFKKKNSETNNSSLGIRH